jgi:hypothetical protein
MCPIPYDVYGNVPNWSYEIMSAKETEWPITSTDWCESGWYWHSWGPPGYYTKVLWTGSGDPIYVYLQGLVPAGSTGGSLNFVAWPSGTIVAEGIPYTFYIDSNEYHVFAYVRSSGGAWVDLGSLCKSNNCTWENKNDPGSSRDSVTITHSCNNVDYFHIALNLGGAGFDSPYGGSSGEAFVSFTVRCHMSITPTDFLTPMEEITPSQPSQPITSEPEIPLPVPPITSIDVTPITGSIDFTYTEGVSACYVIIPSLADTVICKNLGYFCNVRGVMTCLHFYDLQVRFLGFDLWTIVVVLGLLVSAWFLYEVFSQ